MKINEIFYSLQGEGMTAGAPKLFIRLSGCTLQCSFCDTKYHIKSRELNSEDIRLLKKHKQWCITGGEPLLHQKEIMELIDKYQPEWVEIETNGTVACKWNTAILFNCSPKEKRFQPRQCNPEPILLKNKKLEYIVKFVYTDKKSEKFIKDIVKKYKLPNWLVYVMPEGRTKKELEAKQKEVWEFCLNNQYNFSDRFQVKLFGKKKGI